MRLMHNYSVLSRVVIAANGAVLLTALSVIGSDSENSVAVWFSSRVVQLSIRAITTSVIVAGIFHLVEFYIAFKYFKLIRNGVVGIKAQTNKISDDMYGGTKYIIDERDGYEANGGGINYITDSISLSFAFVFVWSVVLVSPFSYYSKLMRSDVKNLLCESEAVVYGANRHWRLSEQCRAYVMELYPDTPGSLTEVTPPGVYKTVDASDPEATMPVIADHSGNQYLAVPLTSLKGVGADFRGAKFDFGGVKIQTGFSKTEEGEKPAQQNCCCQATACPSQCEKANPASPLPPPVIRPRQSKPAKKCPEIPPASSSAASEKKDEPVTVTE
ncbi:membrane hypothetical protein [Candidatus Terasakiella magnetica]|nr:membrane hypothetical protein [Candidatus Terasakiella magnetica]